MLHALKSLIPSFLRSATPERHASLDLAQETPLALRPLGGVGHGITEAIPANGLKVVWSVVDSWDGGEKIVAKGSVVVRFMSERMVRAKLAEDLTRIFGKWDASHGREYHIAVQSA